MGAFPRGSPSCAADDSYALDLLIAALVCALAVAVPNNLVSTWSLQWNSQGPLCDRPGEALSEFNSSVTYSSSHHARLLTVLHLFFQHSLPKTEQSLNPRLGSAPTCKADCHVSASRSPEASWT